MKKIIALVCIAVLCCVGLTSCRSGNGEGAVYYLNFKPEQDAAWKKLAKQYTQQTGTKVTVVTAASGQYEDTLSAEIVKSNAPTLFQVNGPVGLAGWKDYCYDLTDTALVQALSDKDFTLTDDGRVLAVSYVLETYGLLYNKTLLERYFALEGAKITSLDQVNNFASFQVLAEDLQARKEELGIEGAFTSAGMDASSDWRFKTHLANLPLYYEFQQTGDFAPATVEGKYLREYRQIWDLYLNNATCPPTAIGAKTAEDALNEFNNGKAVFYQNGTWAWGEEMKTKLGEEQVGMMPVYIGADGEEAQGLCTGSENYWCVNKNASEADRTATLAFLEWLVTSAEGASALAEMGFVTPFKNAVPATDPLNRIAEGYLSSGRKAVAWCFTAIPSDTWKDGVGAALLAYAQGGQTDALWQRVETAFTDGWKSAYDAAHGEGKGQ